MNSDWLHFAIPALALSMVLLSVLLVVSTYSTHKKTAKQVERYISQLPSVQQSSVPVINRVITAKENARLTRLLANAGFHKQNALSYLLFSKLFCGFVVIGGLLSRQILQGAELFSMMSLTWVLIGYVFGANLPEWWLKINANRNCRLLRQATPDAIDLLVLCVESGLSLNRAFERVARYLQQQNSPMAEQFRITSAELEMLSDRSQALNNLSWRTGVPELHTLSNTLQMAERYGSPLADTLRNISEDARRQRALALEEEAGKLPGKITLIQMALIMLPMLVMIIAPIMSQLLSSLA